MDSKCQDTHLSSHDEYPPRADLRKMLAKQPLPTVPPGISDSDTIAGDKPTQLANSMLETFNAAFTANDAAALESCFFPDQAYWKDQLALTYHLRTFTSPKVVTAALLKTSALRKITGGFTIDGPAHFMPMTPELQFIVCGIRFKTCSPAATCKGNMFLLPYQRQRDSKEPVVEWKIWILGTLVENLDLYHEDERLLHAPGRQLDNLEHLETDVFIIGGGNAAVSLAARLKAFGVDSVMVEKNDRAGLNWGRHYDCMRFHIPTSAGDMAYMPYPKELRSPHLLSKDELAAQVARYVETFHLNMITSAQIQSTQYSPSAKQWEIKFQTPAGQRTAISKHLVLATGFGSQIPNMPSIANAHLYQGISIHSTQYQNTKQLKESGVNTVLIIGSANTAFDILEDTVAANFEATMLARSSTYVFPLEYVTDPRSIGAYDTDVAATDNLFGTIPTVIDANLSNGLMTAFAVQEPNRYDDLAAAGFPVLDGRNPNCVLHHNLLERGGGHYVDIGGTKIIAEGKARVKAGVEPVAYTETGVRLSDGSEVDADAVVWCTGFADKDVRRTAVGILGGAQPLESESKSEGEGEGEQLLGPDAIASRLDATWGVDEEGEIRGMWKRQLRLDNFWIMGGFTTQHRWHSRTLALQIKAALEGILPPAYRDTPTV